ncbi:RloB family protein [Vibrio campbellii]|uniref:RloB family protein n=1 Tax=Vibrio campbellii TaxID=680 RepID=UPI001F324CB6|nr:RloB family protein [Vibrio campbellii]MCE7731562.1 RloB family protein [Vibrio campbellii]
MLLKRPAKRGSKYNKKIDPKTFYVAYEGIGDEKEYFELFPKRIERRFLKNFSFIPVEKTNTDAEPVHVLRDLEKRMEQDGIKINKDNDNYVAYIVIDTDHHFTGTHTKETVNVLQKCRQKGIKVALTNPCFEVWLMCHLEDLSKMPNSFHQSLIKNEKIRRHNTYAKVKWSEIRKARPMSEVLTYIEDALINEDKINCMCKNPEDTPPDGVYSGVGTIFKEIKNCGIPIK